MAKKGKMLLKTGLVREPGEILFLAGKEGQEVEVRAVAAAKGGKPGRCVTRRKGKLTKKPCGYIGKAAKRGAKKAAKKAAKKPAKRTAAKRTAAKRSAKPRSSKKIGFAKLSKADRVKIARKGGKAAQRKAHTGTFRGTTARITPAGLAAMKAAGKAQAAYLKSIGHKGR